jgi:uncharacterized protein (TIGR02145 family)
MKKFLFSVCAVLAILGCGGENIENLPPLDPGRSERETLEEYEKTILASSSSSEASSGMEEPSSSSQPSISSNSNPICQARACCAGSVFDEAKDFCFEDQLYTKCGGSDYAPSMHFCLASAVTPLCGGQTYTSSQFCLASTVTPLCGGQTYTSSQFCHTDNKVYNKCGGEEYDPSTQFCYNNSKVGEYCGNRTEIYNPDLYECKEGSKIYLKTPVSYEGEDYEAVLIVTQTWFARNLNYNPGADNSACSDNEPSNCNTYGRLYDWVTAMGLSSNCNSNSCSSLINSPHHRGVCPSGWHIPSYDEWETLSNYVQSNSSCGSSCGTTMLKATSGWNYYSGNGTDEYGFSALPGGLGSSDGYFSSAGYGGNWWSASESNSDYAYSRYMYYDDEAAYWRYGSKSILFSVRCLQD